MFVGIRADEMRRVVKIEQTHKQRAWRDAYHLLMLELRFKM
jgi:hypothetical protein